MPRAFYNEHDPTAAQWLRNLIAAGHIADGDVDERSIVDLRPAELVGYTQVHLFAGVGVWSLALRRAGWPDDRPAWTGSCPCQPFSTAGRGGGFDDERHLWPAMHHLVRVCRPDVVLGEQVASKDGLAWLDLVQADVEGEGYAFGSVDTCAAGVGAPHLRQRLYWVADAHRYGRAARGEIRPVRAQHHDEHGGATGELGDAGSAGLARRLGVGGVPRGAGGSSAREAAFGAGVHPGGVADTTVGGRSEGGRPHGRAEQARDGSFDRGLVERIGRPGPTNGLWRDPDWIYCRDGRWRPVESGTFPLAYGAPARVGRLRAYGNAVTLGQAQAFTEAVMEAIDR